VPRPNWVFITAKIKTGLEAIRDKTKNTFRYLIKEAFSEIFTPIG